MAFSNQFALSLEVTRLLPWAAITDKATQAVVQLARSLDHSGSDIVVENDLVEIFGRGKVAAGLGSSFKNIVKSSASTTSIWNGISLQGGPGPTMERAFKEAPFFSMTIQLSLLAWCYHIAHVAHGLANTMIKRQEGAPEHLLKATPTQEGVLKVLKSCEKQTSAFDWNMLLAAVAESLSCPERSSRQELPEVILRGAIDMFPIVQSLPQDRLVYIQIPRATWNEKVPRMSDICPLVVWAHHILGLTVSVKFNEEKSSVVKFGDPKSSDQVVIEEVMNDQQSSITLLDASGEELLRIKPDPEGDDSLIGAIKRVSVKDWASNFLLEWPKVWNYSENQQTAILRELQVISCAFAQLISKHMIRDDSERLSLNPNSELGFDELTSNIHYSTDKQAVIALAKVLFRNAKITQSDIDSYLAAYTSKPLNGSLPLPTALAATRRSQKFGQVENHDEAKLLDEWDILCTTLRYLSIYILAFAHIQNPEECESLVICGDTADQISEHEICQQLESWNGEDRILVKDDAWLQAIAILLIGAGQPVWELPWSRVCLVSDKGWSAWLPTFGGSDPEYTSPGDIFIGKGSPCRRGVWRIGVWDLQQGVTAFNTNPALASKPGEHLMLLCSDDASLLSPWCGENGDVFFISSRIKRRTSDGQQTIYKYGYRELHKSLWWAQATEKCGHKALQYHDEVELPLGCAAIQGFGNYIEDTEERVLVCLTTKSVGARWLALGSLPWTSVTVSEEENPRRIMIRRNRCCWQCAIDQAMLQRGKCYVIL